MLTASKLAVHIIRHPSVHGLFLSNSRLQSLLYYSQAWHLALFDRRLFADQIEARESGPVMPLVDERFERLVSGEADHDCDCADIPDVVQDHLDGVMERYGTMTDDQLVASIQMEAPWIVARATNPANERHVIELVDMKLFYRYPLSDAFIRAVVGVVPIIYQVLVRTGIYQTSTAASAWIREAWEAWKIIFSSFCMIA